MQSKKRIALFMGTLGGGGAERVMLTLAEALAKQGLDVDMVVTRAHGPFRGSVPTNVRLVDLRARRIVASIPALVRYMRRTRPEVMLSALSDTNCVAVWARALARVQLRLLLVEHTVLSIASAHFPSLRGRLMPYFMRLSYPYADRVIAVSCGVADDLAKTIQIPRSKIEVIYNPIVTAAMLEKSRETVQHPWLATGGPPVVLGVGRLTEQKDFSTLIRAFAHVRRERIAKLIILGEGEEKLALAALIANLGLSADVSLPGFVANPYAYMRRASVFILSSRWEGLPTVLVEAMACGIPVVATDCPAGPSEILEDGKWGSLVSVGDPEALANAIVETLDRKAHPDVRKRAQAFSSETVVRQYVSVLGVQD